MSLLARVGSTTTASLSVTVTVDDVDEAGTLALSSTRPQKGSALTATLTDPDGVTGTATYRWERSAGRSAWTDIVGATASSYTPTSAETGHFLRVTATYTDGHGSGKTVTARTSEVVAAYVLSALAVTTTDDAGWRQMHPDFDAETLHYRIGCGDSDTMTVTLSAANAAARVAVDGRQTANPNATVEVAVTGSSDVPITLTGSDGAHTTYVVHCLPDDFLKLETIKHVNAGTMEDLILFKRDYTRAQSFLTAIDNNGVPRLRKRLNHRAGIFFRPHQIGENGAWQYAYGAVHPTRHWQIVVLDQNFKEVERVTTVAPLAKMNGHDHRVLDDGNYLLMAYEPATRDLSHLTGFIDEDHNPVTFGMTSVHDSAIQIVTPARQAAFTWNSWDAMAIEDCYGHRFPPDNPDYAHLNGLQLYDGDIIATFRGCSKVLRIDPELAAAHKVVWRLGRSNLTDAQWEARDLGPPPMKFVHDPEGEFCGMHGGKLLPNGNLIIFDNGAACVFNPWTLEVMREVYQFSRGVEYAIDEANSEAIFLRDHSLHGERAFANRSSGHIEDLANGDWLISWGRSPSQSSVDDGTSGKRPDEAVTQVDPDTGVEKLSIQILDYNPDEGQQRVRAIPLPPVALAAESVPLTAEIVAGSAVYHSGINDTPGVVVAFNRPVADFDETSPSLSVTGATITTVAPYVAVGAPAHAYRVTLTSTDDGPITFGLVADEPCADGGICTADGTLLTEVPTAAHTIPGPVTVSFGATSYAVTEGGTTSVVVELNRAHGRPDPVEMPLVIQTGGTATENTDYTVPAAVTFGPTETSKTVSVVTVADASIEEAETVAVAFGALPTGVTAGTTTTTTVTITDQTAAAQFTLTLNPATVVEGETADVTVAITNGVTFATAQTLTLSFSGSATQGSDYTVNSPTLRLLAEQSSATTTLRVLDDVDTENAETISVAAHHGTTPIPAQTATIPASDQPAITPHISVRAGPSPVGEAEGASFTVTRTGATTARLTVAVRVTESGSLLAGPPPTTVTFAVGQENVRLPLPTVDDTIVEGASETSVVTVAVQADTTNDPAAVPSRVPRQRPSDRRGR